MRAESTVLRESISALEQQPGHVPTGLKVLLRQPGGRRPTPERKQIICRFDELSDRYLRANRLVAFGPETLEVLCVLIEISSIVAAAVAVSQLPVLTIYQIAAIAMPVLAPVGRYLRISHPGARALEWYAPLVVIVLTSIAALGASQYLGLPNRIPPPSVPGLSAAGLFAMAVGAVCGLLAVIAVWGLQRIRCHLAGLLLFRHRRAEIVCEIVQVMVLLDARDTVLSDLQISVAQAKMQRVIFLVGRGTINVPCQGPARKQRRSANRRSNRRAVTALTHRCLTLHRGEKEHRAASVDHLREFAIAVALRHSFPGDDTGETERIERRRRRRRWVGHVLAAGAVLVVVIGVLLGMHAAGLPDELLIAAAGSAVGAALVRLAGVLRPPPTPETSPDGEGVLGWIRARLATPGQGGPGGQQQDDGQQRDEQDGTERGAGSGAATGGEPDAER